MYPLYMYSLWMIICHLNVATPFRTLQEILAGHLQTKRKNLIGMCTEQIHIDKKCTDVYISNLKYQYLLKLKSS